MFKKIRIEKIPAEAEEVETGKRRESFVQQWLSIYFLVSYLQYCFNNILRGPFSSFSTKILIKIVTYDFAIIV